ncbi:MAG: TIGR03943 family protein [Mycobacterium sp.]
MNREAENALLLLVGISTAIVAATGTFTRYVKPSLLPWLIVSAVGLITLALASTIRDLRHPPHDGHDGHSHANGVVWALGIPVVVLIFVAPPALSPRAATATVQSVSNDVLRHAYPPLPDGSAPEVSLPAAVARASYDSAGSLNGRTVTIVGFTYKDGAATDLARITITCCAADARLSQLRLIGPESATAAALPENTWLQVRGIVSAPKSDASQSIPLLMASSSQQISAPSDQYAYLTR